MNVRELMTILKDPGVTRLDENGDVVYVPLNPEAPVAVTTAEGQLFKIDAVRVVDFGAEEDTPMIVFVEISED